MLAPGDQELVPIVPAVIIQDGEENGRYSGEGGYRVGMGHKNGQVKARLRIGEWKLQEGRTQ